MYVRQVDGKETTFGVSGKLYRDSLVMFDRKTRSLWSQVSGKALKGKHKGDTLARFPAVVTSWGEWKAIYPETVVFAQPRTQIWRDRLTRKSPYEDYYLKDGQLGIFGTENPDDRLDGKTLVFGTYASGQHVAFPVPALVGNSGLANGQVGRLPIVVHAAGKPPTALAFLRRVGDETLTFDAVAAEGGIPLLRDRETQSIWLARLGVAVQGPLKGERLSLIDGQMMYWFVWAAFHPETEVWSTGEVAATAPSR